MPHLATRAAVAGALAVALVAVPLGTTDATPSGHRALVATDLTGSIAYVCEQDGGTDDELCLMDADGTDPTRLTTSPGPDRAPNWDPDGDHLVFNSRRGDHPDRPQIYQLDVGSGIATRISHGPLEDQRASWTPDGTAVIFQRGTFATGYQLQRQDLATGTVTALTDEPGRVNAAGSLDPDGTRLLHQSNRDAPGLFPFGTYATDTSTGTTSRLAATVTDSHDGPRWSPTGDRVAFAAGGSLYVVDVATGTVDRITDGTHGDSAPAWSPDGTRLVFQSDRLDPDLDDDADLTTIHVIDLASGDVVDLGEGRTPVWSALERTPDPEPATTTTEPETTTTSPSNAGPTTTVVRPATAATAAAARPAPAQPVAGRPSYAG